MMKNQKGYVLVRKRFNETSAARQPFIALARQIARWVTLYRQRQYLARLSDDALKDIGVSRADIEQEVARPFWYDPMKH